MPTSLPDHTTPRRLPPRADVTRRTSLQFPAWPSLRFTALLDDLALWLRCWRVAPRLRAG